jgi:hypothetical protein
MENGLRALNGIRRGHLSSPAVYQLLNDQPLGLVMSILSAITKQFA